MCGHAGCTWTSSASTPSSRLASVTAHEASVRAHADHTLMRGDSCAKVFLSLPCSACPCLASWVYGRHQAKVRQTLEF